MPTYQAECSRCQWRGELFATIGQRDRQKCPMCGARAKRVFAVPFVQTWESAWFGLDGPTDSVYVTSKAQLFEECKKRGKFAQGYGQENRLVDANAPRNPAGKD